MKTMIKAAILGMTSLAAISTVSIPAVAQTKLPIAVVNLDRAASESNAYRVAMEQMQVTYKAAIDSYTARQTALDADLRTKQTAFQTALQAAGQTPTPAQRTALQTQYDGLQQETQSAREELQRLGQPIALARAYIEEQIVGKLPDALKAAMTKGGIDIVLKEAATESFKPSTDLTAAVTAELNTLVPSVGIVPPTGWQPASARAAGGAAAPAAGAAPAAAAPAAAATPPAAKKPKGR